MKNLFTLLFFLSLFIIAYALCWIGVVYFQNWKYVLTTLGKISVYWKPDLLLIVGAVICFISIKKI